MGFVKLPRKNFIINFLKRYIVLVFYGILYSLAFGNLLEVLGSDPISTRKLGIQETSYQNTASFQLYGSIDLTAYWFADIYLGFPKHQRQSLIIDTGSSVTGFPCKDCGKDCGHHIDSPYNPFLSQTWKPVPCSLLCTYCLASQDNSDRRLTDISRIGSNSEMCAYYVGYTEGSKVAGRFNTDRVLLYQRSRSSAGHLNHTVQHHEDSAPMVFGCHFSETHLFIGQLASGIAGMQVANDFGIKPFALTMLDFLQSRSVAQEKHQNKSLETNKKQLSSAKTDGNKSLINPSSNKFENAFSICFSQSGGIMTFGGYHNELHLRGNHWKSLSMTRQVHSKPFHGRHRYLNFNPSSLFGSQANNNIHSDSPQYQNNVQIFLTLGSPPTGYTRLHIPNSDNSYLNLETKLVQLKGDAHVKHSEMRNTGQMTFTSDAIQILLQQVSNRTLGNHTILNLGTYPQNTTVTRHLACFMQNKPLDIYYQTWEDAEIKSNLKERGDKYYLIPSPETQSSIFRCLKKGKAEAEFSARRKHAISRTPYYAEYTSPVVRKKHYGRQKTGVTWDVWTEPLEVVVSQASNAMVKGQNTSTMANYSDCKMDENQVLHGSCASLQFAKTPWCIWNVSQEDILTVQDLILSLEHDNKIKNFTVGDIETSSIIKSKKFYIPSESVIQWTPFLSINNSNGIEKNWISENYYVVVKKWALKGLPIMPQYIVSLPLMDYPTPKGMYPNPSPTRLAGLVPMIDSGTTLSSVPLLVYASLWIGILGHIARAKEFFGRENVTTLKTPYRFLREETQSPSPLRIQGISLYALQHRVRRYIQRMQRHHTLLMLMNEKVKRISPVRSLFKNITMKSYGNRSNQKSEHVRSLLSKSYQALSRIKTANELLSQLNELQTVIENQLLENKGLEVTYLDPKIKGFSDNHALRRKLNEYNETATQSKPIMKTKTTHIFNTTTSRSLFEEKQLKQLIETTDLGSLIKPHKNFADVDHFGLSNKHFRRKRLLRPKGIDDPGQECWYLTNGDTDLQYFAEMELTFLENAKYIWRPHSFLYKYSGTNVYCLAILLNDEQVEEWDDFDDTYDNHDFNELDMLFKQPNFFGESTYLLSDDSNILSTIKQNEGYHRVLLEEDLSQDSAIFGASFFINHDIIFHIERWSMGMIEANCPLTNLTERVQRPPYV